MTAFADQFEREQILKVWGYPEESWNNIREEKAFLNALAGVREQGCCEIISEEREVYTIAFPLLLPEGNLLGAIGCYAPLFRCPAKNNKKFFNRSSTLQSKFKQSSVNL